MRPSTPSRTAADDDRDDGRLEPPLVGEPDRRQPEAQRDQRDDVRHDDPERHRLEQALSRLVLGSGAKGGKRSLMRGD